MPMIRGGCRGTISVFRCDFELISTCDANDCVRTDETHLWVFVIALLDRFDLIKYQNQPWFFAET